MENEEEREREVKEAREKGSTEEEDKQKRREKKVATTWQGRGGRSDRTAQLLEAEGDGVGLVATRRPPVPREPRFNVRGSLRKGHER